MDKKEYLDALNRLEALVKSVPNTPMAIFSKVATLVTMNMRYEKVAFNKELASHPYTLTKDIINDTISFFKQLNDIHFIESPLSQVVNPPSDVLEEKHEELWQEIWSRHNEEEFREFIELKSMRLTINNLEPLFKGGNCVDMGCGNGSFSFALLDKGANAVTGIDFGKKQIAYAQLAAKKLGYAENTCFIVGDVYDTGLPSDSFDFAVSNGVFHHLSTENMEKAVAETARILKPGGSFWYYIDGAGAISMDLWDASVAMLKEVPVIDIENVLKSMNISRNKMVHIVDGLNATYYHSTLKETTEMLEKYNFTDFRRVAGGTSTDFDEDCISADPYGKEKFGDGDLRIVCRQKG